MNPNTENTEATYRRVIALYVFAIPLLFGAATLYGKVVLPHTVDTFASTLSDENGNSQLARLASLPE